LQNPWSGFNQKSYLSTNLILKDKIAKKILIKKLQKKKNNKNNGDKIWQKNPMRMKFENNIKNNPKQKKLQLKEWWSNLKD
jgi:hypothetical protein